MKDTAFTLYTNHTANHQVVSDYHDLISEHEDGIAGALTSLRAAQADRPGSVVRLVPPFCAVGGEL
jgi:hypothetical protein